MKTSPPYSPFPRRLNFAFYFATWLYVALMLNFSHICIDDIIKVTSLSVKRDVARNKLRTYDNIAAGNNAILRLIMAFSRFD